MNFWTISTARSGRRTRHGTTTVTVDWDAKAAAISPDGCELEHLPVHL